MNDAKDLMVKKMKPHLYLQEIEELIYFFETG